jgi:hypothetical protein
LNYLWKFLYFSELVLRFTRSDKVEEKACLLIEVHSIYEQYIEIKIGCQLQGG